LHAICQRSQNSRNGLRSAERFDDFAVEQQRLERTAHSLDQAASPEHACIRKIDLGKVAK
jgi:hypothetical protein